MQSAIAALFSTGLMVVGVLILRESKTFDKSEGSPIQWLLVYGGGIVFIVAGFLMLKAVVEGL